MQRDNDRRRMPRLIERLWISRDRVWRENQFAARGRKSRRGKGAWSDLHEPRMQAVGAV